MNWHYVELGQQRGPVADAELANLFRTGVVNADTPVWHEGLADWIPFREAQLDTAAPPPLPPAVPPIPAASDEVVCAECGRVFPTEETIQFGKARVCAACKPAFLQKLSEGARLHTGEWAYAGFGIRFGAKLIDGLILIIPFVALAIFTLGPVIRAGAGASHGREVPPGLIMLPYLMNFGILAIRVAYDTFFLGRFGATPGKMVCKIKVVTADGRPLGYGRAACRALAEILSTMICYIGYLLVLFDKEKRALHDHICGTRVILIAP